MLVIDIPKTEIWDSSLQEFITLPECSLSLEHSLISVSLWESKWHKPFLSETQKTSEEALDYIRCMVINKKYDKRVLFVLSEENMKKIEQYIADPMTATTVRDRDPKKTVKKEIITSEVIYYWMTFFNIPFECEKWNLNRLLMLIKVCAAKQNASMGKKPMSAKGLSEMSRLNAQRRQMLHTKG